MKRLAILAAAMAVTAVMVVPSVAQANLSNWTDNGAEIQDTTDTIPFHGTASFSGGTVCTVNGSLVLHPGSTGTIHEFTVIEPTECEVTGTLKALGCADLHDATVEGLPWDIHNTTNYATITDVKIINHYSGGAFCPKTVTISGNGVTATPDNTESIGKFTLGGTLSSSLGTEVTVGGTLTPTNEGDVGTYGLH